ncbi:hypothetical protein PVV47_25400, partial [Salmonella enterica subsp. enterica serovar London]
EEQLELANQKAEFFESVINVLKNDYGVSVVKKRPGKSSRKVRCVFRSIRSRIGIEVRSAIRIHSINRELNFFYRFLTRFFAAF